MTPHSSEPSRTVPLWRAFRRWLPAVAAVGMGGAALGQLPLLGLEFWFERPMAYTNTRTAIGQAMSLGALLSQVPGSIHPIDSPGTWKKELIGHGNAKPAEYRAWLTEHHPALASLCGEDEDLAAAHCIALWAGLAP